MFTTRTISGLALALMCVSFAQAQDFTAPSTKVQAAIVSEYWIGIHCRPVDEFVKSHMKLPDQKGLIVENVFPDSPAEEGELQRHDVIAKVGGKSLGTAEELVEAVEKSQGKPLKLDVIRAGKTVAITVTPKKRPKQIAAMPRTPIPGDADWKTIQEWFERVGPDEFSTGDSHLRFIRPGAILPPGAKLAPPMPGNMIVRITKQGNKPAEIIVEHDGKKWETDEDNLDKLPKDIRPHVERLLGQGPHFNLTAPQALAPGRVTIRGIPAIDGNMEKRMDEMMERMDRLFELVEELRSERETPKENTPQK